MLELGGRYETIVALLNTPVSYSADSEIRELIADLDELIVTFEELVQAPLNSVSDFIGQYEEFSSDEVAVAERFVEGFRESSSTADAVSTAQIGFLQEERDHYQFALENLEFISVEGAEIFIDSDSVLETFNAQLEQINGLDAAYAEAYKRNHLALERNRESFPELWTAMPPDVIDALSEP
jgi:hypothetical protein